MQDPELAVQETRRCITELGLSGIEIGSHVNDWTLAEKELFPVFKTGTVNLLLCTFPLMSDRAIARQIGIALTAAELGAAVFIHPWDMIGQSLMSKYWLPW